MSQCREIILEWAQFCATMVVLGALLYKLPVMTLWLQVALGGLCDTLLLGIGTLVSLVTMGVSSF